jgi:hypothetical protein
MVEASLEFRGWQRRNFGAQGKLANGAGPRKIRPAARSKEQAAGVVENPCFRKSVESVLLKSRFWV